ncbi:MAG: hypothetical protein WC943_06085 [Elusimicrobiota bacterium]
MALLGALHVRNDRQPRDLAAEGWSSKSFIFLTNGLRRFESIPGSGYDGPRVFDAEDYRVFLALGRAGRQDQESLLPASLVSWPCNGYLSVPEILKDVPEDTLADEANKFGIHYFDLSEVVKRGLSDLFHKP